MLTKTDKNKYRSLLFRHIDGIALSGPISELENSNLTEYINNKNSFTIKDITSIKKCNDGYINVTIHLLRCQGWIELNNGRFSQTDNGKKAFKQFSYYKKINKHIPDLIKCNDTLFEQNNDNNYISDILETIKEYSQNTDQNITSEQIYHHLTGLIIGPLLVSIGMSQYYQKILQTMSLTVIEEKCSKNTYKNLNNLFKYLNWIENQTFTNKGEFYLKRASAYGVTTSYLPIYSFMNTVLFENVTDIWKKIDNES